MSEHDQTRTVTDESAAIASEFEKGTAATERMAQEIHKTARTLRIRYVAST